MKPKRSQKVASNSQLKKDASLILGPTKITNNFVHCGLGYSASRQGMLVVNNNAVNKQSIKVTCAGGSSQNTSPAALAINSYPFEIFKSQNMFSGVSQSTSNLRKTVKLEDTSPDKVEKNITAISKV